MKDEGAFDRSLRGSGGERMAFAFAAPILASIAFIAELTVVPLLLSDVQTAFLLSDREIVWVFNIFALAVAPAVLVGGWLGDRMGKRSVFLSGTAMFAAGALICAFAPDYPVLLFGRVLQGVGGGIFSPLIPVLLIRIARDRPGRVLILWGSVTGLVATCVPLIGGLLIETGGWRLVFAGLSVLACVAVVAAAIGVDRRHEERPSEPPDFARMLHLPKLWLVYGYVFLTYGCFMLALFKLPQNAEASDVPQYGMALLVALLWFTFSTVSAILRNLADGGYLRTLIVLGPLAIGVGTALVMSQAGLLTLTAGAVIVGIGLAVSNAPSTQLVLKVAPRELHGISASLDITFARLGGAALVFLLAQAHPLEAALWIGALSLLALSLGLTSVNGHDEEVTAY